MTITALPRPVWVTIILLWSVWISAAQADDSALCRAAIGTVEAAQHIPDAFLSAIARVESGRADPATGTLAAWPWTINAEGTGSFFDTKAEAIAAVRALQARGVRSIDVGCLQVNLLNHPEAFASLEQAFDPGANAAYAGTFLLSLFAHARSWPRAAAAYHSQTPTIGAAYQRRVLAEWAEPAGDAGQVPRHRAVPMASIGGTADEEHSDPGHGNRQDPMPAASAGLDGSATRTTPFTIAGAGPAMGHMTASTPHGARAGSLAFTGRSLAAYRLMPTALAFRLPPRRG